MPAGGSAEAAATAMAAGLVEKAAHLSSEHWIGATNIGKRAAVLRKVATLLIDADVTAYTEYIKALRAARGLHTVQRERLIAPARKPIVDIPLSIVRSAAEVAGLAAEMAQHGNPSLRSDAHAALQLAAAAARAASVTLADNVRTAKDGARLAEAQQLSAAATALARRPPSRGRAGGRGRGPARTRGSAAR